MDETRCPVLDPGRGRTKTGFLWAIARDERPFGGSAPPGVVLCYADGRGGKHAADFLTGFQRHATGGWLHWLQRADQTGPELRTKTLILR